MKLFPVLVVVAGVSCVMACSKISSYEVAPGNTSTANIQSSFQGRVINEQQQPVAGAVVASGNLTDTTDADGYFQINTAAVNSNAAVVTVQKAGYLKGIRTLIANGGRWQYVQLALVKQSTSGATENSAGGTLTFSQGSFTLAPNQALTAQKQTYTGTVNVQYAYLNPAQSSFPDRMPGDGRGVLSNKTEVGLQSFGLVNIALSDPGGNALMLDTKKSASVSIPIPGTMQDIAPTQISLWHFEEGTGLWKESGKAVKQNNQYTATITEAGYWQCAVPFQLAFFTANVVDGLGNPVPNTAVTLATKIDLVPMYAYTDAGGRLTVKVPLNSTLITSVNSPCNKLLYYREIGPFSDDAMMDSLKVSLPMANTLVLQGGVVNCANQPVQTGQVVINVDGRDYLTPVSKGAYNLMILRCGAISTTAQFTARDQQTGVVTSTSTFVSNGNVTTNLVVCNQ
jgi:hypothetical protein